MRCLGFLVLTFMFLAGYADAAYSKGQSPASRQDSPSRGAGSEEKTVNGPLAAGKEMDAYDLEPEVGPYVDTGSHPYDVAMSSVLVPDHSVDRLCEMVVQPMVVRKEAVFIVEDEDTSELRVVYRRTKSDVWGQVLRLLEPADGKRPGEWGPSRLAAALGKLDGRVDTSTAAIDRSTVQLLSSVWTRMLLRTHFVREVRQVQDGISFHFGHRSDGKMLGGRTSSPPDSSLAADFVLVGEALIAYVTAKESLRGSAKNDLEKRARNLLKRLDRLEAARARTTTVPE